MASKVLMTSPWKNTSVCENCGYVNDYFFDAPPELCDFLTGIRMDRGELWSCYNPCPRCEKKDGKEKVIRVVYVSIPGKRRFLFWRKREIDRYFEEMTNDGPKVVPLREL